MYTLKIVFAGLIAFVPISEESLWWAVLVNGEDPSTIPCQIGAKHHSHHAALKVRYKNLLGEQLSVDGDPELTHLIGGYDLEIDFGRNQVDESVDRVKGDRHELFYPQNPQEERSFRWVPRLYETFAQGAQQPHHGQICETCLGHHPDPGEVAARVRITAGSLGTETVARRLSDEKIKIFNFGSDRVMPCKDDPKGCQAVAQQVFLEVPGLEYPVTLVLKEPSTGRVAARLELKPADSEPMVEVQVLNQTWQALGGDYTHEGPEPPSFKWFHKIDDNHSCKISFPIPSVDEGSVELGNPWCPVVALLPKRGGVAE